MAFRFGFSVFGQKPLSCSHPNGRLWFSYHALKLAYAPTGPCGTCVPLLRWLRFGCDLVHKVYTRPVRLKHRALSKCALCAYLLACLGGLGTWAETGRPGLACLPEQRIAIPKELGFRAFMRFGVRRCHRLCLKAPTSWRNGISRLSHFSSTAFCFVFGGHMFRQFKYMHTFNFLNFLGAWQGIISGY